MRVVDDAPRLLVTARSGEPQAQVDAPGKTDDAAEDGSVLKRNEGKADDGHKRPNLLTGEEKRDQVLELGSAGQDTLKSRRRMDTYAVQSSGDEVKRLALQQTNTDDEHGVVDEGTQCLIQGELDGGILDVEFLWSRSCSWDIIDLLLDSLAVMSAEGLGTGGSLVDASASFKLLGL